MSDPTCSQSTEKDDDGRHAATLASSQGGGAWSSHRTYEGELYYYNKCSGVAQWEAPLEGIIRAAFVLFVWSTRAPSRVPDWNPIIITHTVLEMCNIELALRHYGYLVHAIAADAIVADS